MLHSDFNDILVRAKALPVKAHLLHLLRNDGVSMLLFRVALTINGSLDN